ncbi:MAG: lactate racemase domain-containing protein, partial [Planctomycetaceae bacterium]|nr:lactate racemase domain-containing protein [Planctomycetaceae bacterium]
MNISEILAKPLGFPSLSQMVFPGDRVFLVPDAEYAEEPKILTEIVHVLLENGFNAHDIQILLTDSEELTVSKSLKNRLPSDIQILFHRPGRRDQHALLGINKSNEPISLCRDLIDADLVISIGRFYAKHDAKQPKDHFGLHSAIFPRFSDSATQH